MGIDLLEVFSGHTSPATIPVSRGSLAPCLKVDLLEHDKLGANDLKVIPRLKIYGLVQGVFLRWLLASNVLVLFHPVQ